MFDLLKIACFIFLVWMETTDTLSALIIFIQEVPVKSCLKFQYLVSASLQQKPHHIQVTLVAS